MQVLFFMLLAHVGQTAVHKNDPDEMLRGLDAFVVAFEPTRPGAPVTAAQLRTDTELRLRSLGMEIGEGFRLPYLPIRVSIVSLPTDDTPTFYCYSIEVSFRDSAMLESGKQGIVSI